MHIDLSLPRRVQPELLDAMVADEPAARRARGDLRRLHWAMGTLPVILRALDRVTAAAAPRAILELGAGDGSLMLRLARRRAARWPGVALTLLDRQRVVETQTLQDLCALGWEPAVVTADALDWLDQCQARSWDLIIANLFIHHFSAADLSRLCAAIAGRTRVFFCCEPRRALLPLLGSHLVGALGSGPVTREDAVRSVHAGFRARELTAAWPAASRWPTAARWPAAAWQLHEYSAGLFNHCLLAIRRNDCADAHRT